MNEVVMNMRRWLPIVLVCLLAGGTAALSQDLAALLEEAERAAPAPVLAPPADDPGRTPAAARPAVVDADASEASRSTQDRRTPLPAAAEALTATSRVKAVFRERYSGALKPADKAALATEILELLKSTSNQADRWALLSEALRLASEGGQVDLAIATAKTLSGEFQVESADMMLTVLKQLSSSAPPAAASRLASECAAVARRAANWGQFETATKAIVVAKAMARKGKDPDLVAQINRLTIMVKDREKMDKRLTTVLADLKGSPTDTALNAEAGLLLCLLQDRWAEGLPLLMKAGNPALARLAQLELNDANTLREQIALGDAWWSLAESQKSPMQDAAQQRALRFYNEAVNGAEGLERAMLEKRIASLSGSGPGSGETVALADLQELETAELYSGVTKNGTFNGQAYTCGGVEYTKGIYTPPKTQSTAMIAFRPPAGARRLRGGAGVFSMAGKDNQPGSAITMEIAIDGDVVWKSPALVAREQMARFDVPLNNGSRVELRTRTAGNNASCWGAWLDPVFVK